MISDFLKTFIIINLIKKNTILFVIIVTIGSYWNLSLIVDCMYLL